MDPVRLELFSNRFGAIASEMGVMLQRTAMSVNVKERLDFSCGMLDAEGRLLVNAPHIPVHLGALGECVRRVAAELELGEGCVAVTNHPGYGGSHLPDITVISPVLVEGRLLGYVANRAHHAELGGIRPGSMPPEARSLAEEGVVIAPQYLVRGGEPQWERIEALLSRGPAPSRSVAENLADLGAAVAANRRGVAALRQLAADAGEDEVRRYMSALYSRAADRMRSALEDHVRSTGRQSFHARERLDDGSPIEVG
ncbi:MAG: hydantoinase B/oxoprolinase family protein, partial [Holophagales bacterium]|nr:hydantoinase B/oxoprolinase family protein [Holophagales bacterium]